MKDVKTAHLVSATDGQELTSSQIVVLHIPHSSRQVPAEERQGIRLDDAQLNSELLGMTDAYTDELFPRTPVEARRVIFPLADWFAMSSGSHRTKTSLWQPVEWASSIVGPRWAKCFERCRAPHTVNLFWTVGIGRII
jgi:hypothetical protein